MSNVEAIGAVTATLQGLLAGAFKDDEEFSETEVTVKPLDKARGDRNVAQLNLFLVQPTINGAWRNQPIPQQIKPGELGAPPLPLDLHYLLTAWGIGDEDLTAHQILGRAMSVLHDHAVLGTEEIKAALKGNDLHRQVERVRITPQPVTIDEISKLWSSFATSYRVSSMYEVSVVLIESRLPAKAPQPVLTRGRDDAGFPAQASLNPPFPTILGIQPPNDQPAARLGEVITITGFKLDATGLSVQFTNPLIPGLPPIELPANSEPSRILLTLPDDNNARSDWVAGLYAVTATLSRVGDQPRKTNVVPFALAPAITAPDPLEAVVDPNGNATLALTIKPNILPDQHASLLLGDREIKPKAHDAATNTLTFAITKVGQGQRFLARLRIDGVDSVFIGSDSKTGRPIYDESQIVTFT
jgi:uncharacterized protein DUF4255